MRLVRDNGDVVQESVVPLLGGRLLPSLLHAGNVVRDEQTLLIGPLVSPERVSIEAELPDAEGDPVARLGSLDVKGRAHVFDASKQEPEAVFGGAMELLTRWPNEWLDGWVEVMTGVARRTVRGSKARARRLRAAGGRPA